MTEVADRNNHIYLVGFMGSGKSTAGPLLAKRLKRPFIDLDFLIESRAGKHIPRIFAEEGESAFRRLETQALEETLKRPASVVSLGGGAFGSTHNRRMARKGGLTVWIDIPLEEALERCRQQGGRPLAQDESEFRRLYRQRRPDYRKADRRIDAAGLSPRGLCNALAKITALSDQ